jgi:hypothetical protein
MDYYNIIKDILYDKTLNYDKILIIIDYNFNILEHFSHIIKTKNLDIHIIYLNNEYYSVIEDQIKGEELENSIHIYKNIENINIETLNNKLFNIVNILNVSSLLFIKNTLTSLLKYVNLYTLIEIYATLSNENMEKIEYKNYIRELINNIDQLINSNVISFSNYLKVIESLNKYEIKKISIYKKNNYIMYGNNIIYKTILYLK